MPKYYLQVVLTTRPHAPQNVRCYAPTLARDLELMTTTSHPSRCWWLMLLVGLDSFANPISAWVRALPPNYAEATKMGCGTSLRWNYYVGQYLPQYAYPTVLEEWLHFWEWNAIVSARLACFDCKLFVLGLYVDEAGAIIGREHLIQAQKRHGVVKMYQIVSLPYLYLCRRTEANQLRINHQIIDANRNIY